MRFDHQRRLAAALLKCGLNRVRITTDPAEQESILDAITREQVRELIARNVITRRPERGVSRGRTRKRAAQRAKGRRRGHGTRKGAARARTPKKKMARRVVMISTMIAVVTVSLRVGQTTLAVSART